MSIVARVRQGLPYRSLAPLILASIAAALAPMSAHAADPGKKACMPDAKRLCSAEMRTLSRSRVQACLIVHMEQTSPTCHDFMVKARAAAMSGHKPDPSAQ